MDKKIFYVPSNDLTKYKDNPLGKWADNVRGYSGDIESGNGSKVFYNDAFVSNTLLFATKIPIAEVGISFNVGDLIIEKNSETNKYLGFVIVESMDDTFYYFKTIATTTMITNLTTTLEERVTTLENGGGSGGGGSTYYFNDTTTSGFGTFWGVGTVPITEVDSSLGVSFNVDDLIIDKYADGRIYLSKVTAKDEMHYTFTNLCGTELVGRQYDDCAGLVLVGMNSASHIYATKWGGLAFGNNNSRILRKVDQNPIRDCDLDYAVKVGMTTNKETLTDDEKASAKAWLGIDGGSASVGGVTIHHHEVAGSGLGTFSGVSQIPKSVVNEEAGLVLNKGDLIIETNSDLNTYIAYHLVTGVDDTFYYINEIGKSAKITDQTQALQTKIAELEARITALES